MKNVENQLIKFDGYNHQIVVLSYCDGKDLHIKANGEMYLVRSGVEGFFDVPERVLYPDMSALDGLLKFIHDLPFVGRYVVCEYNSCTIKK